MSETHAVVTWQDKLKGYAVAAAEAEQPQGQFFSIRSGILSFGGNPIPNNLMDCIVVGSLFENAYYEDRFDPTKPASPVCFAFSFDGKDMQPHERSAKQQSPACNSCPQAKWGSDPKGGKGKACKNLRRLALMSASVLTDVTKIPTAQVGYLRVPVMSVANYQRFVAQVAQRGLPPFAAVVRVKVVPDPKSQFRVEFEPLQSISDNAALEKLLDRFEMERKLIDFPYETITEATPDPQAGHAPAPKF